MPTLDSDILEAAMQVGRTLDLSDCMYGPPHWRGRFKSTPAPYYAFLAGFMRVLHLERAMEVGTHYAGSTIALMKGVPNDARHPRVVTVDVTALNLEGTARYSNIVRLHGDSLDPSIARRALRACEGRVDVLFVDAAHTYRQTLENVAVYANRLNPRFIIIDDIRLNTSMRALWRDIERMSPGQLFDASEIVERPGPGFGIIEQREGFHWPESRSAALLVLRGAWALRRSAGAYLPADFKGRGRALKRAVARAMKLLGWR